jgi:hypothetical protein
VHKQGELLKQPHLLQTSMASPGKLLLKTTQTPKISRLGRLAAVLLSQT